MPLRIVLSYSIVVPTTARLVATASATRKRAAQILKNSLCPPSFESNSLETPFHASSRHFMTRSGRSPQLHPLGSGDWSFLESSSVVFERRTSETPSIRERIVAGATRGILVAAGDVWNHEILHHFCRRLERITDSSLVFFSLSSLFSSRTDVALLLYTHASINWICRAATSRTKN